jgi:CRISPR/Cas system endoribonuclease Cas6 (RAMP superfamily)
MEKCTVHYAKLSVSMAVNTKQTDFNCICIQTFFYNCNNEIKLFGKLSPFLSSPHNLQFYNYFFFIVFIIFDGKYITVFGEVFVFVFATPERESLNESFLLPFYDLSTYLIGNETAQKKNT